jgi:hypothetical protein
MTLLTKKLKIHYLLASFFVSAVRRHPRFRRGFHSPSSFLGLQESLHGPVDLSVHSLLVPQDPVHISFRQQGAVVKSCVRPLSFDIAKAFVQGFDQLFPVRDAGQEELAINLYFNGFAVLFRLNLLAFFFLQERRNLPVGLLRKGSRVLELPLRFV